VDFIKVYNTVDWDFLERVLLAFGFPNHLTQLIMTCVRTPKFSIALNGELHGFFPSERGLQQGAHVSLFIYFDYGGALQNPCQVLFAGELQVLLEMQGHQPLTFVLCG